MAAERRIYELSPEQEAMIERAFQHPPLLVPGRETESRQKSIDAAWQAIAAELGFDLATLEVVNPANRRVFTAVPRPRP